MNWQNFILILVMISLMNMNVTESKDEKEKDEDDLPKTVWEFIYTDWKTHLDSHMVDLPDLYHLFIDGWVPEEPDKDEPPSKRSTPEKHSEEKVQNTIECFRNWINEGTNYPKFRRNEERVKMLPENYVEWIKQERFGKNEGDFYDPNENCTQIPIESDNQKTNMEDKHRKAQKTTFNSTDLEKIATNETQNEGNKTSNIMKIVQESRNQKEDDNTKQTKLFPAVTSGQKITIDPTELDVMKKIISKILLAELRKKTGGKLKRSAVEALDTPAYCKFFGKCELAICDCGNLQ